MPARNLLQRFRPAGAPGAAGSVGVPTDVEHTAAAELAPVFAALEPTVAQCDRLRADAAGRAEAAYARSEQDNAHRAALAAARAPAERAASAARLRDAGDAGIEALLTAARADAARVEAEGRTRIPELVTQVIDALRTELDPVASTSETTATSSPR